jgi:hypothetical protein
MPLVRARPSAAWPLAVRLMEHHIQLCGNINAVGFLLFWLFAYSHYAHFSKLAEPLKVNTTKVGTEEEHLY